MNSAHTENLESLFLNAQEWCGVNPSDHEDIHRLRAAGLKFKRLHHGAQLSFKHPLNFKATYYPQSGQWFTSDGQRGYGVESLINLLTGE